jgi:8-oxo-dGTP diphosphatase
MSHEVVAALIIQSQMILLGQRSSTRLFYPGVWDVFGGHVEPGEQQHQRLVRELQEELGITPTQWAYLETSTLSLPASLREPADTLTVHLYLVTAWDGTPLNLQSDEHSEIGWFSLAQATQLELADPGYPELFSRHIGSDPSADPAE